MTKEEILFGRAEMAKGGNHLREIAMKAQGELFVGRVISS